MYFINSEEGMTWTYSCETLWPALRMVFHVHMPCAYQNYMWLLLLCTGQQRFVTGSWPQFQHLSCQERHSTEIRSGKSPTSDTVRRIYSVLRQKLQFCYPLLSISHAMCYFSFFCVAQTKVSHTGFERLELSFLETLLLPELCIYLTFDRTCSPARSL